MMWKEQPAAVRPWEIRFCQINSQAIPVCDPALCDLRLTEKPSGKRGIIEIDRIQQGISI